jgi:hypothetical protein
MMQCVEFESRWQTLLDEQRDPAHDAALMSHASHCADCADLIAGYQVLAAGLARGFSIPAPSALATRVVAAVAAPPPPVEPARRTVSISRRQVAGIVSAAAVMLVAVSIAWYVRSLPAGAGSAGGRAAVAGRPAKARRIFGIIRPGVGSRLTTDVRPKPLPAGSSPSPAASVAATSPDDYQIVIDELAAVIPRAAQQLDEVERIAPGIRPLRQSLAMIWETVRRALSGLHTDLDDPRDVSKASGVWPLDLVEFV